MTALPASALPVDSPAAWRRLGISLLLASIGGVGLWSVVVVLPDVQRSFGVDRGAASLPYMAATLGFGIGGVAMGRVADRFGIRTTVMLGAVLLLAGYVVAWASPSLSVLALAYGLLIGLGASATFGPVVADTSFWFVRRRGLAMSIASCGNYLAGALWPSLVQVAMDRLGWRDAHLAIGVAAAALMLPLALLLGPGRPRQPAGVVPAASAAVAARPLGLRPATLQAVLILAGVLCCVAMSMPQVHIVAYCSDLGYGPQAGAHMLSLMLATGVVSRVASGWISDRLGGVATLLLGSLAQMSALVLYLPSSGLAALYGVSALFGLFQGGLVPSYALIVRRYFPANEAATRVGLTLMATLVGMALGGWVSGVIYDATGSYQAAFLNGIAWNAVHAAIAWALLSRERARPRRLPAGAVA